MFAPPRLTDVQVLFSEDLHRFGVQLQDRVWCRRLRIGQSEKWWT